MITTATAIALAHDYITIHVSYGRVPTYIDFNLQVAYFLKIEEGFCDEEIRDIKPSLDIITILAWKEARKRIVTISKFL